MTDQRLDKIFGTTRALREKSRYVRQFFEFIAKEMKCSVAIIRKDYWKILKDERERVANYAMTFIAEYMKEQHLKNTYFHRRVMGMIHAFKQIGINNLNYAQLERFLAIAAKNSKESKNEREKQLRDMKIKQVNDIRDKWPVLSKLAFQFADGNEFKSFLHAISYNPSRPFSQRYATTCRSRTMISGEPSSYALLLKLDAFLKLSAATGLRSLHLISCEFKSITIERDANQKPHEGLFITYITRKNGRKTLKERVAVVRVVPHADPSRCPIVAFAIYVVFIYQVLKVPIDFAHWKPFVWGTDSIQSSQLQLIVYFLCICKKLDLFIPENFMGKRLHIFRSFCTQMLRLKGATNDEINHHCGWENDVQNNSYGNRLITCTKLKAPFLIADRENNREGHAMWNFLEDAPIYLFPRNDFSSSSLLVYLHKIALCALVIPDVLPPNSVLSFKNLTSHDRFIDFRKRLLFSVNRYERNITLTKERTELDNTKLLNLLFQYQDKELNIQPLGENTIPTIASIIDTITSKDDGDFLVTDLTWIDDLQKSMNHHCMKGFGVDLSTAKGKNLVRLLTLIIAIKKHQIPAEKGKVRSWLGWARKQREDRAGAFPAVAYPLESWKLFRNNYLM